VQIFEGEVNISATVDFPLPSYGRPLKTIKVFEEPSFIVLYFIIIF